MADESLRQISNQLETSQRTSLGHVQDDIGQTSNMQFHSHSSNS